MPLLTIKMRPYDPATDYQLVLAAAREHGACCLHEMEEDLRNFGIEWPDGLYHDGECDWDDQRRAPGGLAACFVEHVERAWRECGYVR